MSNTAFSALDPRGARPRFVLAIIAGALAWACAPASLAWTTRAIIVWDAVAFVILAITAFVIGTSRASETRRRAAAEDPGRTLIWTILLAACAFSLFSAALVARQKDLPHGEAHLWLSIGAIVGSWLLAHSAFTLRYAHLYYRGKRTDVGGIEFPGKDPPDDLDFAYFAFTIGMTFQVSDTEVTDQTIRRTVLGHALMSFAFNTVVVAVALNLLINNLS